jgi:hypothetical protein
MKQNNKNTTNFKNRRGTRGSKTPSKNWRPQDAHENNRRIIFGKPYTWNGTTSWILDDTPDSGLTETPGLNVADGNLLLLEVSHLKCPVMMQLQ